MQYFQPKKKRRRPTLDELQADPEVHQDRVISDYETELFRSFFINATIRNILLCHQPVLRQFVAYVKFKAFDIRGVSTPDEIKEYKRNPLMFWKKYERSFPALSIVAKRVFSVSKNW